MEAQDDQVSDSPSKNSYIGSYYQPPDRILPVSRPHETPAVSYLPLDQTASCLPQRTSRNIDAVVDALKTLQDKIRRLELERKQAEKTYVQFSQNAQKHSHVTADSRSETDESSKNKLDLKLRSAEARCKVLEKQLNYMRKMVENVKKERIVLMENEAALQSKHPSSSDKQTQREKLEKLESECLKLSRTQTLAEMKLAILEQKLLKEEHERKLVQEKADELQRELDINLQLPVPSTEGAQLKKKAIKKSSKSEEACSSPRHRVIPFVAGTSTSPSHSVHANVQSVLHMMKQHHPQLCERVSALQKSGCGVKKNLRKAFQKPETPAPDHSQSLLSDLLLALQDEFGQLSFEYQELEHQIEANQGEEKKKDLQRDLERLSARMEEKSVQISKLRKHQEMVHKLTQSQAPDRAGALTEQSEVEPPVSSPVKAKKKAAKSPAAPRNLQLLRETQKFRNVLRREDIVWEP